MKCPCDEGWAEKLIQSAARPSGGEEKVQTCSLGRGSGTLLLRHESMGVRTQLSQDAQRRMTRRLYRSVPWIGGLIALVTLGRTMRRKGMLGGTLDTVLDFIPFVGTAKKHGRGRPRALDSIPDRVTPARQRGSRRTVFIGYSPSLGRLP